MLGSAGPLDEPIDPLDIKYMVWIWLEPVFERLGILIMETRREKMRGSPVYGTRERRGQLPCKKKSQPPLAASFLLELFLPRKQREAFIGDLEQEFVTRILPKYGIKRAKVWFWVQVLKEMGPILYLRCITRLIRRVIGG
jgi:hypothetical protein